jgi:hypothetical protein
MADVAFPAVQHRGRGKDVPVVAPDRLRIVD